MPTVVQRYGAHAPAANDGMQDAWFTQDVAETGPRFSTEVYSYTNDQPAATP